MDRRRPANSGPLWPPHPDSGRFGGEALGGDTMNVYALVSCLLGIVCMGGALNGTAQAQPALPPLTAAQGHDALIKPTSPQAAEITFQTATWPNAFWSAGPGQAWDWRGHATFAFHAKNPGQTRIDFNVRIDDDPSADGI